MSALTIQGPAPFALPRDPKFFRGQPVLVNDVPKARAMVELAYQRPVGWVGLGLGHGWCRPGVPVGDGRVGNDPRSIRPLLLGVALAEADERGDNVTLYPFAIDLRVEGLDGFLRRLLRLTVPFVVHDARNVLFALFRMGLPVPDQFWDSWIHEKAAHLGRQHGRYRLQPGADVAEQAQAHAEAEKEEAEFYSLRMACLRHGVAYPLGCDADRIVASFAAISGGEPCSADQNFLVIGDAVAAAALYPRQVNAAGRNGLLGHLQTVEMPWTVTNARMIWDGVRVDAEKCRMVEASCHRHLGALTPALVSFGVTNVRSHRQLEAHFTNLGLADLFRARGGFGFDRHQLADFQGRHPSIPLIRAALHATDLLHDKVLTGAFVGEDGRVHPEHRQLGASTGRQSCRYPNVAGLGRVFRPLVVPEPGFGIGEVDLCQIEVGVAAAAYGDARLVELFNGGDVYSRMAREFYGGQMSREDLVLDDYDFKKAHSGLRNRMKACTLGLIYGMTPLGLSRQLGISIKEAEMLQASFLGMLPDLAHAVDESAQAAAQRGYATAVSGLRRYRGAEAGQVRPWERNWMINFAVQASAAIAFKAAGNRLGRLLQPYEGRLIIPMHDAFVFEAPLGALDEAARLVRSELCNAVTNFWPCLRPNAETNIEHPECWNKDGHAGSIERWMEDPTYRF
jgi:DNA polymerase-1